MKITSLGTRSYRVPLDPPFGAAWDPVPRASFSETIVELQTDQGISGFCGGASVPDADLLAAHLIGVDPTESERVDRVVQSIDFHGGRNWTVEVALWDLLAKISGEPLWRFLGGARDRCRVYQSTGEVVDAATRIDRLLASQASGISAAKLRLGAGDWRASLPLIEAARRSLGDGFALMVDANQGWRMPGDTRSPWKFDTAAECAKELTEIGVYWLEEPLATEDLDGYRRLRELDVLPIAAGEMVREIGATERLLPHVDIIQNDVVLAGGVAGCRQVAAWARERGKTWSPHTWSTGYGLLANLHVALAWSEGEYLEFPYDPPGWTLERRDFMLPRVLEVDHGELRASEAAGLGVEPDFEALEQWRVG